MFIKKYQMGFDIWAIVLFLAIMIPNLIWFKFPAQHDILRKESATVAVDTIASIFQVVMIICLCFILNKEKGKSQITGLIIATIIACLLYYICWMLYYLGVVNGWIMFGLALFPCLAFLLFALDRKNIIAVVPALVFSVCHLIYAFVNHIM